MTRYSFGFFILLGLAACGGPAPTATPVPTPTVNVAPTQTRAAELAHLATVTAPTAPPPSTATQSPPTPTPTRLPPTPTLGPTGTPVPVLRRVGERMGGKTYAVMIHEVRDPVALPANAFETPTPGSRFVGVDFAIENRGTRSESYTTHSARLKTADGREYEARFGRVLEPTLFLERADPGTVVRGWIMFAVPASAQLATFSYQPDFFERSPVVFDLKKP